MTKQVYCLSTAHVRQNAAQAAMQAPDGWFMSLFEGGRTVEQNAAQWPYLDAFSKQLEWPVNGQMVKMQPDEWKDVLTAAFQRETARLAMGLDGGVVMLGQRTSQFGKKKFSEWIEFLIATAALRGVTVYRDERMAA
jgi:hypothetical protein